MLNQLHDKDISVKEPELEKDLNNIYAYMSELNQDY